VKAYFGRRYMFSASHRLHSAVLSVDENRQAYGKCNNPHGHGHNYVLEVLVAGPVDAATGMVVNLVDLDQVVHRAVLERFDHQNLNQDEAFQHLVPTTENLCSVIFELLLSSLPEGLLSRLRLEETENNFFQMEAA